MLLSNQSNILLTSNFGGCALCERPSTDLTTLVDPGGAVDASSARRKASVRNPGFITLYGRAIRLLFSTNMAFALFASGSLCCPTAFGAGLQQIRDTETETLLLDYARPILKASGLGVGRFTVGIVRDGSARVFTTNRRIFVSTGLLQKSETPNQIVGLIAHEIGHIAGGHAFVRGRLADEQTQVLQRELTGSAKNSDQSDLAATTKSLTDQRVSHEIAASTAALQYLDATGQSGRGLLEVFEKFADRAGAAPSSDDLLQAHPQEHDGLARLADLARKSAHYQAVDPPELKARHDLMQAKLSGYLVDRRTVFGRYPESDTSIAARYARAIARYFMGGKNAVDESLAEVDTLVGEEPANPYFWELKGDLLMRAEKAKDAIQPLRKAFELMPDAPLIQVLLANALQKSGGADAIDESLRLLRKAVVHDTNPSAHRLLASAHYKKGELSLADAETAQAYFLEGNVKQAQIFAKRSLKKLKKGSPEWLRTDDILRYKPGQ